MKMRSVLKILMVMVEVSGTLAISGVNCWVILTPPSNYRYQLSSVDPSTNESSNVFAPPTTKFSSVLISCVTSSIVGEHIEGSTIQ